MLGGFFGGFVLFCFSPIWMLFSPVYFAAYYFSQLSHYSSHPPDFPTKKSFCIIKNANLTCSKLTKFSSSRNTNPSAVCPQFKCSFSKLPHQNITLSWKRGRGCGIRQFDVSAFSVAFWIQHCRSGIALQHASQNSQEPSSHLPCLCCVLV